MQTACLGLISGANIEFEKKETGDEWVIILGAAGSVGQYAVQVPLPIQEIGRPY